MEARFKTINLNDYVFVKLKEKGYQRLVDYDKKYGCSHDIDYFKERADADGYTRFQLWNFMQIFGKDMYLGNNDIGFDINIKIEL